MSDLHVDLVRQEMEASGEMDFIRSHVAAAAGEDPAPAPEADTEAEVVEEEEAEVEDSAEEEVPTDAGTEEETELDDSEVMYLELDDDTQALLESKYGGDISKMLAAAREGQSLIGRQGNELGELRAEIAALRAGMEEGLHGLRQTQPYPEWPDEFDEGPEAAAKLREVAETAYQREDVETFQRALAAWQEADPVSAGLYRDLKEMQIRQAAEKAAPPESPEDTAALTAGLEAIRTKYPQFVDPAFQAAVNAELDRTPSLKAVLWNGIPGTSVAERLAILDEAAQRVSQRQHAETETKARKRIAVRVSEEARAARVAAQVTRGGTARGAEPEVAPRTVPLGTTGQVLNLDRLNAMLSEEDRI